MINYDILVDKDLIKDKLIEYLKSNYDKYKNLDIDKSTSQSFIVDVQTFLTNLVSNRFEQQVQDFYLTTSQTDKINLLLSQYGYEKTFGIPSQVILKLEFSKEQMYELNELDLDTIFIPPLVLKVQDDNGNIWINKNSLLIIKTPEIFDYQTKIIDETGNTKTITKDFYKYKITSSMGVDEIQFVQMEFFIRKIIGSGKRFEKLFLLSQNEGYPVQNFTINDYIDIFLKINPFVIDTVKTVDNRTIYKLHDKVKQFVQSKYHTDTYETFVKNDYMIIEYDEVNETFNIFNGDNENSGYNLNGEMYVGFYMTKGDRGNQLFGSINTFAGLVDYLMLNNTLYYLNTDYPEINLKNLFIPNKIVITKDLKTGRVLSQDQIKDQNQQIYLQDLFNSKVSNETMNKFGWKPLNILVTQVEPVIVGKGQEKLESLKYNFSDFLKSKDKIVTRTDIEQYLNNFLKNITHSLNQISTYKNQFTRVYVDKIRNVLKILPVVLKSDNMKQITFPKGNIIYPSELPTDLYKKLNYTYEKQNIIKELEDKVIQTMEVEYQNWELLKIYTKSPVILKQFENVSINSIIQQIKDKLNQIVDVKNKFYDLFDEFNFLDMLMSLNKTEGLETINIDEFLNKIGIKGYREFYSNYIFPLQIQRFKTITDKLKTFYVVPLRPHQDDEDFISDTLKMYMFNSQQGETEQDNVNEEFEDKTFYTEKYVYSQPVNVSKNIKVDLQNKEEERQESLINLNYMFDSFNTVIYKYKDFLISNPKQVNMVQFRQIEKVNETSLKDKYRYIEKRDINVDQEINMQIRS